MLREKLFIFSHSFENKEVSGIKQQKEPQGALFYIFQPRQTEIKAIVHEKSLLNELYVVFLLVFQPL